MSETLEYVNHLSREIGPRPAGTEEERRAAEFIADTFEQSAGLPAQIEDFSTPSGNELPHVICMGLAVIAGVFSLFSSVFTIPAIILLVIATALLIAELKGQPLIMKLLSKGASQNVIAKYEPGYIPDSGRGRTKRVVIVARYDSGKVRNELTGPIVKALPIASRISFWSVPALLVLVLIRGIFLGGDTGVLGTFFGALIVIGVVFSLIPLVFALLHQVSPYNEAANSNAAGVAAMMEVANRVGRGRMTEAEIANREQEDIGETADIAQIEPTVHGAEAAYRQNAVPEGAQLYYDVEPNEVDVRDQRSYEPTEPVPSDSQGNAVGRLAAAKAAIAAMTGGTVSEEIYAAPAEEVSVEEVPIEVIPTSAPVEVPVAEQAVAAEPVATFAYSTAQPHTPSVPDWFAAAQKKAKANKPVDMQDNVKRSRYADALDAAVSASSTYFSAANQEALTGMDAQIEQLNDGIVEVKAPGFEDEAIEPQSVEALSQQAAFEPQPVVGHADNDILAGVVDGIDVPEQSAISMPSFLDESRPVEEGAPRAQAPARDRVVVNAYTDEPVTATEEGSDAYAESFEDEVSPFALPIDQPEPIEPVSDFVGQVTQGFEAVGSSADDPMGLSSKIPRISMDSAGMASAIGESAKMQRAPLADETSTAKSLLSMLPSIDPLDSAQKPAEQNANVATLRATLPSLSGTIPAVQGSTNVGSAGATGVFAPVGDELVKSAVETETEEELFIEDADDSDFQENFTDSGAYAGPDYIEMPSSPVRNFFDKIFHRNKKKEEVYYDDQATDEYYDDAQYDDAQYDDSQYSDEYYSTDTYDKDAYDKEPYDDGFCDDDLYDDDYYDDEVADSGVDASKGKNATNGRKGEYVEKSGESWNGGALSALKDAASNVGGKASEAAQGVAGKVHLPKGDKSKSEPEEKQSMRRGRFSSMVDEPVGYESSPRSRFEEERERQEVEAGGELLDAQAVDQAVPDEFSQVQSFRNPDVNAEVWFVALGSELAGNSGMRAFLDQYGKDLRGAIIVELDAFGAGKLSLVETEGTLKKVTTSSRMKRYLRKITQTTGINFPSVHMGWNDSASSYANAHGQKAMHLVGFEGGKPALFAQDDDVVESIDEETLEENVDVVMELLRII